MGMMRSLGILMAVGIAAITVTAGPAHSCTPAELGEKQKAFAEAAKAAYQRDPGGDEARQAKVKQVIERYSGLKNSTNGRYIIDMICKENDELLAIYK
jgi:hypothetical protein